MISLEEIKTLNKDNIFEQLDALWDATTDGSLSEEEFDKRTDALLERFDEIKKSLPPAEGSELVIRLCTWLLSHSRPR